MHAHTESEKYKICILTGGVEPNQCKIILISKGAPMIYLIKYLII